jgi:cytochrome c oxidase cbb3-type subunit I/II
MAPGSIMPSYPSMFEKDLNTNSTPSKIHAMRKMGVPYPEGFESIANDDLERQARLITANLKQDNLEIKSSKEIIALIAYLQRLGTDIKVVMATTETTE